MGNPQRIVKQVISITSILFYLYNVSLALAVPNPSSDTWTNLSPTGAILVSSQSSIVYDPENDAIYMWGGHPPGGSFPQVPEFWKYDVITNTWSVIRPVTDQPYAFCVSQFNDWDLSNKKFLKFQNVLSPYGQYLRNMYLYGGTDGRSNRGIVQLFDPLTKKWTFFHNTFSSPNPGGLNASYDVINQVVWMLPKSSQGTYSYDPNINLWTQRRGWNQSPPDSTGATAYDYHQNKLVYYAADLESASGHRITWIYDPSANTWANKTPSPLPAEWTKVGESWVQGTTYPSQAYAGSEETLINPAAVYDSINKKVLVFISIQPPDAWEASTYYGTAEAISSVSYNGFCYTVDSATGDQKTGSVEPTWPTTIGDTVVDNHITWKCKRYQGSSRTPRLEIWAYDVATDTWEHKTNFPTMYGSKRGGDLQTVFSRKHNLAYVFMLSRDSTAPGYPVNNQYYVYRYATATSPLGIPENVSISLAATPSATISWNAVSGASGYNVYRASGNPTTPWLLSYSKLNTSLITETSYTDSTISNENNYFYYVVSVDGSNNESDRSPVVRTQPYLVTEGYVSVNSASSQKVNWTAVANAVSYNVYRTQATVTAYGEDWTKAVTTGWTQHSGNIYYRSIYDDTGAACYPTGVENITTSTTLTKKLSLAELSSSNTYYHPMDWRTLYVNVGQSPIVDTIKYSWGQVAGSSTDTSYTAKTVKTLVPGSFTKLNSSPITNTYYDDTVDLSGGGETYPYKVYAYRVVAVNVLGVEGGNSPHWFTIPSAPMHLNWKEAWQTNSGKVKLKWTANPESGIKGYNVYRQWGDYTIEKVGSVISGTTFTDTLPYGSSGMGQMGYYVSAIDTLDQEGIPGSRALVNRSYKSIYDSYGYLNDYYSGIDIGINPDTTPPRAPLGLRILP